MKYSIIECDQLREMFDLRPGGVLIWKKPSKFHKNVIGKVAGSIQPNSSGKKYRAVSIGGRKYKCSHVVFCLANGRWPNDQVDHRDGNSLNDDPTNLREATPTQNAWNHKGRRKRSGLPMGVKRMPNGRFQARIAVNKKKLSLGTFASADKASEAYRRARTEHFGEFA
jgi:hypothetical protein